MNLKNKGLISLTFVLSVLVIAILIFCFWPLPDSVTDENTNLKTAEVEAKRSPTVSQASVNTSTDTTTVASDSTSINSDGYLAALDGVNGLRDKAIAYYERTGNMPGTADLLNAPVDSQSTTTLQDSSFLDDHQLGIIGLFPAPPTATCPAGIKIEGIYNDNGFRIIYDLVTVNVNGGWKTICTYGVEGADPASIKVDNCFNNVTDKAEMQKELFAIQTVCGG